MSTVDEKAVELMDRTADAFEAFAGKIDTLATEYGPEVVDTVLWVARIDALQILSATLLLAVLALLFGLATKPIAGWTKKIDPDWDSPLPLLGYLSGAACIVLGFIALLRVFDPWPWVGVVEPQLWIAKQILGL